MASAALASAPSSPSLVLLLVSLLLLSFPAPSSALVYVGNVTALPSAAQLQWHSYEVGVMITWNLQTFCLAPASPSASRQRCQVSSLAVPSLEYVQSLTLANLSTDAWMAAAASFGAKYAVLVVDHMTGFTLWPTRAHNVSIAATRWKGGKGDVIADYLASCAATGIAPGFFYSTHYNWILGVNNYRVGWPRMYGGQPLTEAEYEDLVLQQLAEIAAYAPASGASPWFEVWFDGGVNTVATPRVGPAVQALFPQAVCHSCFNFTQHGPGGTGNGRGLRWMGNEQATMPLPSWGAIPTASTTASFNGDPEGQVYVPPSCDTVFQGLNGHLWFWQPGAAAHRDTACMLVTAYLTSVGRACNLILNMAPNPSGGLDDGDAQRYAEMGAAIACLWSRPLGSVQAVALDPTTGSVVLPLQATAIPAAAIGVVLMEEMGSTGQRIAQWQVDACYGALDPQGDCTTAWAPLLSNRTLANPNVAMAIGHKRILRATTAGASAAAAALRFTAVTAYRWSQDPAAAIVLARFEAYDWTDLEARCLPQDPGCQLPAF
jgi:alpha-L-fucosidase